MEPVDHETQSLKDLIDFITNRESAKPWFDYHKLLIDNQILEFKEQVTSQTSKPSVQNIIEFDRKSQTLEDFLNFLKLLKPESLKNINQSYMLKNLFLTINSSPRSFHFIHKGFIQEFKEQILGLSAESQIALFKDMLEATKIIKNNNTLNKDSTPSIITLFKDTLKKSSPDSFDQALANRDLLNLLKAASVQIQPEYEKLYKLSLLNKDLSSPEFHDYLLNLRALVSTNQPEKTLLKVLALEESHIKNPSEALSISVLKKLADIFDINTLITRDFLQVINLTNPLEDSPTENSENKISQQDILNWLTKIKENFQVNDEASKIDCSNFIQLALKYKENKNNFLETIRNSSNTNQSDDFNRQLFQVNSLPEAQKLIGNIFADSPPYMRNPTESPNDPYPSAMSAAHRVARAGIDASSSFWSLAWLARNIPQDIEGQLNAISGDTKSLGYKSTLEEFAENFSLEPFQLLTSEKAQDYPGTGFIIKGLNLPKILGFKDVSDEDIESKSIYKAWTTAIENLLSKDPKNSGYLQNRYNLSGIMQDAEESKFVITRGFIAITPPDKLLYSIRCSDQEYKKDKYTDYIFSDPTYTDHKDKVTHFSPDNKLHKTSRWNIIPEHFSLIVFNDHFGGHENHERSYLVPTKVLEAALKRSVHHPDSDLREYSSSDKKYLDFTDAKMKLEDLENIAKEMKLPLLDLTSSSNIGSLSNAFPKGWKTYHNWENDLNIHSPHETKERTKGHYHKTHYEGRGYKADMRPYMNLIYPLQEAENNIDHVASSLQGIQKVLQLSLNSFINGRSFISPEKLGLAPIPPDPNTEPNAHYMLARAYKINSAFSAQRKDKKEFPILVKQKDFTRLSHLQAAYPQLDTYDMTLKTRDENGKIQEKQLSSDPNDPETLKAFLEAFMNNINPDNSIDIFKGVLFMPREILFSKPNLTKQAYAEIIK
jgi:hypothetical protein